MGVVGLAVVTGLMEAVGLAVPDSVSGSITMLGRFGLDKSPLFSLETSGSMNLKARSHLAYLKQK